MDNIEVNNSQNERKKMIFDQFLNLKLYAQKITHKKIVHKIFIKYIRNFPLKTTSINLENIEKSNLNLQTLFGPLNQIEIDFEIMPSDDNFQEIMNSIRVLNLNELELNFDCCNTSVLLSHIKMIKNCLIYLKTLKKLSLNLYTYYHTYTVQFFQIIESTFYKLPSLSSLSIEFFNNNLNDSTEKLKYLLKGISSLKNLKRLSLGLCSTSLGQQLENIKNLSDFLINQKNLIYLKLNLADNVLNQTPETFSILVQALSIFAKNSKLEELVLQLYGNDLCYSSQSILILSDCLQNFKYLKKLNFDIGLQEINNQKTLKILGCGLKKMASLRNLHLNFLQNLIVDRKETYKLLKDLLSDLNLTSFGVSFNMAELGNNENIVRNIGQLFHSMTHLEHLSLELRINDLGYYSNNMNIIGDSILKISSLKSFTLDLGDNKMDQNIQNMQNLANFLQKMSYLNTLTLYLSENTTIQNLNNYLPVLESLDQLRKKKVYVRFFLQNKKIGSKNLEEILKLLQK